MCESENVRRKTKKRYIEKEREVIEETEIEKERERQREILE